MVLLIRTEKALMQLIQVGLFRIVMMYLKEK